MRPAPSIAVPGHSIFSQLPIAVLLEDLQVVHTRRKTASPRPESGAVMRDSFNSAFFTGFFPQTCCGKLGKKQAATAGSAFDFIWAQVRANLECPRCSAKPSR